MLKIDILAVGKLKEAFWRDACNEYLKRLGAYAKVTVQELPDSCPCNEAPALFAHLDALSPSAQVVLLDIKGKEVSSELFAEKIDTWMTGGVSHLVFIIGGSEGVTYEIKQRAHERMSFGPITMPHNMVRVVLLEQIYRAERIINHEPYHK